MTTGSLLLKNPKDWFAAGPELKKALSVLSDGAFRLFVYICLHARRDTGCLHTVQAQLAQALGRSRGSIARHIRELKAAGVCRIRADHNPKAATWIEVTPEYWPYQRTSNLAPDEAAAWIAEVRKLFLERACVKAAFSAADERLARQWFEQGVTRDRVAQAILLGCARKYTAWRNGQERGTIGSLRYFELILQELDTQPSHPEYWQYVQAKIQRMENQWIAVHPHYQPMLLDTQPLVDSPPASSECLYQK